MYCTHCGKRNADVARFCLSCSAPIGVEEKYDIYDAYDSDSVTKSSYEPKKVAPKVSNPYTDYKYPTKPIHNRSSFRPIHLLTIFYGVNMLFLFLIWLGTLDAVNTPSSSTTSGTGFIFFIAVICTISFAFLWLPTIIGSKRTNGWAIFWINLLLAWTIIGWVIALVMSLSYDHGKRLEEIEEIIRRGR